MVDLTNSNGSTNDTQQVQEQKQQQCFTRSDVATTRRAIQDLKSQSEKLKGSLSQSLTEADNTSLEEFRTIWDKRDKLNQVNNQVKELEQSITEIMPSLSKAKLSNEEKNEIAGLYNSKLYTQSQLAEQYGVSQPTIGDVVKKNKS
ncbi:MULTISPECIES: hypothetical protein [unclassified Salinivibrio]|uniref:hypothetical protein n=1 Tax=unclassified Salinivibrio TaxID=2636825 RepID=UPI000984BBE7|nr:MULTISPECIES: hypothetical protein [unclassified Salinivibrio]OOF13053.1 hypothetical protein BZG83_09885 [Salinivibrio sp. PR919]OOF18515.1 hypothetical protein BZG84_03465 [Salinivibrio sp. PR932]